MTTQVSSSADVYAVHYRVVFSEDISERLTLARLSRLFTDLSELFEMASFSGLSDPDRRPNPGYKLARQSVQEDLRVVGVSLNSPLEVIVMVTAIASGGSAAVLALTRAGEAIIDLVNKYHDARVRRADADKKVAANEVITEYVRQVNVRSHAEYSSTGQPSEYVDADKAARALSEIDTVQRQY